MPFCVRRCKYCAFVSCTDMSRQKAYVGALAKEIAARSERGAFDTVYVGGGTPSTLYRGGLTEILSAVRAHYALRDPEITVECNPDSATPGFFAECADNGVNRISIGLQTADDEQLRAVGRPHDYRQFLTAYERARAITDNVSVDVMLGLPGDTAETLDGTLDRVLRLEPAHVSLYALKVEDNTPLAQEGFTVDEDLQADRYARAYERLIGAGFRRYEVSNFCRPGRESRHNCKYWRMNRYLGFGAAAHSFTGAERLANTDNIAAYIVGAPSTVTPVTDADFREEYIMLALRTAEGIDLRDYRKRFGVDLLAEKSAEIQKLASFLLVTPARLRLRPDAFYVMNAVIARLL